MKHLEIIILFQMVLVSTSLPVSGEWFDVGSTSKQYYIGSTVVTWNEAVIACMKMGPGARLATFSTKSEMDLLGRFLKGNGLKLWIGIFRPNLASPFIRLGTAQSDFFIWDEGEPNNENNEECVELRAVKMVWNDVPCNIKLRFLCEADKTSTSPVTPSTPVEKFCGSAFRDWKYFEGHCYSARATHESAADWKSAEDYCWQKQSHLVSIHDINEQNFVFKNLLNKNDSLHQLWSGLQYTKGQSSSWSDGSPMDFTELENGTHDVEGCGSLNLFHGMWNLADCSRKLGFVCKIPQELTTKSASTKDCEQVNDQSEHSHGDLTVGIVINILVSVLILSVLIFFLVKRWPVEPKLPSCFKTVFNKQWTTLKEEEA